MHTFTLFMLIFATFSFKVLSAFRKKYVNGIIFNLQYIQKLEKEKLEIKLTSDAKKMII